MRDDRRFELDAPAVLRTPPPPPPAPPEAVPRSSARVATPTILRPDALVDRRSAPPLDSIAAGHRFFIKQYQEMDTKRVKRPLLMDEAYYDRIGRRMRSKKD
eukprot:TRINITY_DN42975_c0_g2_i1.p1 TRINITY_DN42975_c0_g2~~TRINITY_DN42975_c0_g2_i1.p1  ORF type:complete len:102 (+),score=6.40 TRINITY_DN42975_c0_g2_i1:73-378(+)